MDPIGNNVATQVGDLARPKQTAQDQHLQADAAREQHLDAPPSPVAAEDVASAVAQMQQVVEAASGRNLHFQVFEGTEDVFVEIRDAHTEEVIKQIPAQDVLEMRARISEVVGLLFDNQA